MLLLIGNVLLKLSPERYHPLMAMLLNKFFKLLSCGLRISHHHFVQSCDLMVNVLVNESQLFCDFAEKTDVGGIEKLDRRVHYRH